MNRKTISLAIAGSGGAGVMTTGAMLLEAAARAGYYGLFSRLFGPQIRGGEAAALLTIGLEPLACAPDAYDLFVAVDWGHVERFTAEVPLTSESVIVADPKMGDVPAAIAASHARQVQVPIGELVKAIPGGRANMVALGLVAGLIGLPRTSVDAIVESTIGGKGATAVSASQTAVAKGMEAAASLGVDFALIRPSAPPKRWLISGNEALALGALRGGVRFVAGYPITPATEVVEWLAPVIERVGGQMVQAEDELSAINMVIGGSYAGVPSMTVTSGPGYSLMAEALGLAVAAEIPLVVIDVQRAGPSTGIPTKSEQSDLNVAVYGVHGDAPHVVVAPTSLADSLPTAQWAVELAETLQTPAIVLSDQSLGQTRAVIDAPHGGDSPRHRASIGAVGDTPYKRYATTESGVSPMAAPGIAGAAWVADGLTHTETGAPTSAAKDHHAQLAKRARKLRRHDFGERWADIEGDGELAVITWGSTTGPVRKALARLRAEGVHVRLVAPRLLAPAQPERLAAALAGVKRAMVVEQNHSAQLYRYLRAHCDFEMPLASFARPGPLVFRTAEIHDHLSQWSQA